MSVSLHLLRVPVFTTSLVESRKTKTNPGLSNAGSLTQQLATQVKEQRSQTSDGE